MTVRLALRELHRSERKLANRLDAMAARHRTEQDIYHLARDLAGWSRQHVKELAEHGRRYGLRLSGNPQTHAITGALQSRLSGMLRHRPEPGLLPKFQWTGSCWVRSPRPSGIRTCWS